MALVWFFSGLVIGAIFGSIYFRVKAQALRDELEDLRTNMYRTLYPAGHERRKAPVKGK